MKLTTNPLHDQQCQSYKIVDSYNNNNIKHLNALTL